jgi:hypothetical protein
MNGYDKFIQIYRVMPKSPDKKTISVVIPQEAYEELKAFAGSKDWTLSNAAKNLIVEGLERQKNSTKGA